MSQLAYRVFTAKRPGINPEVPPGHESLMWVANSATLIYGARDAVLVDTFFTLEHSAKLVDQVDATGKNLTHIYITHGHGDHFFGIDMLKRRFPNVRAVAPASVVDRIDNRLATDMQLLRERFPGQIPDDPVTPETLDGASIDLEGHPLIPVATGFTDSADSTSLHVPSLGLIAAGDVVYNGTHPFLTETTAPTRLRAALNAVERAAEDDLRDRAADVGERGPELVVAQLPHQHRLVQRAAAQITAELLTSAVWKRNSSSLGAVHPNSPSRSAITPSTETLIE